MRLVRIVLTVRPADNASLQEVSDLVTNLLKESGSGDETDVFTEVNLVQSQEEVV